MTNLSEPIGCVLAWALLLALTIGAIGAALFYISI
jgi:hypothetical protein